MMVRRSLVAEARIWISPSFEGSRQAKRLGGPVVPSDGISGLHSTSSTPRAALTWTSTADAVGGVVRPAALGTPDEIALADIARNAAPTMVARIPTQPVEPVRGAVRS
jgi:hypothetical protein